jgi:hypothetical protein
MKKKLLLFTLALFLSSAFYHKAEARQGFGIGLGPIGNIFLIDTIPIMSPGVGGHVFFDYRFHEFVAFSTGFMISSQDGTNVSSNDNNILFLGMPEFNVKFFFLTNEPVFDPFLKVGLGLYFLTEGSSSNNSGGVGVGSQLGLGFDYYLTEIISLGFEGVFRPTAVITDFGTPSNSSAIFPYTLSGNVAFHF